MKQVVYLIVDNGVDGRMPTRICRAFLDEQERDDCFNDMPISHRRNLSVQERVADLSLLGADVWQGLDGLEKLALRHLVEETLGHKPELQTIYAPGTK